MSEITEAAVFELKLKLQHQQEKIEYLAGGTTGAEIIDALMEKQDELEEIVRPIPLYLWALAPTSTAALMVEWKRVTFEYYFTPSVSRCLRQK